MHFKYYYKTSDNVRHEAEISAPSRDEAFAALRDRGIRPIKVVAAKNEEWRMENERRRGVKLMVWIACALTIVALVLVSFYIFHSTFSIHQVMAPQGPVTFTVAQPLARQRIPGDRSRIENGKWGTGNGEWGTGNGERGTGNGVFKFAAEVYLAQYAEPGRPSQMPRQSHLSHLSQMSQEARAAEFEECLKEPIRIASNDFTEIVDLKRIVTGMKNEMRAYLSGGGTVSQYLGELAKRQKLEISYRDNAERKLNEMLLRIENGKLRMENDTPQPHSQADQTPSPYKAAYEYWLKANAQLRAMGIYELPLPDALRAYQTNLDLDE